MSKRSILPKRHSHRHFVRGIAASAAIDSNGAKAADFRYRLGSSQPLDSPNCIRLKQMAGKIRAETGGRMQIDVFADGKLGSDNAMLDMLQKNELEMYIAGNVFGPLVPVTEMPGLPFTFKNSAEVFATLDSELGDHICARPARKGHLHFPTRI